LSPETFPEIALAQEDMMNIGKVGKRGGREKKKKSKRKARRRRNQAATARDHRCNAFFLITPKGGRENAQAQLM
jgi:hypothetical protein